MSIIIGMDPNNPSAGTALDDRRVSGDGGPDKPGEPNSITQGGGLAQSSAQTALIVTALSNTRLHSKYTKGKPNMVVVEGPPLLDPSSFSSRVQKVLYDMESRAIPTSERLEAPPLMTESLVYQGDPLAYRGAAAGIAGDSREVASQ